MITDLIKQKLAELEPEQLEIVDESAGHLGHAGAASGGGHYRLFIVANQFTGMSAVARHRLIYQQLGELMTKQIHALSIKALSPSEQRIHQPQENP